MLFFFLRQKKNSQNFEILAVFFFFAPGKVYTVLTNSNLRAKKKKKKKTASLLTTSFFSKMCAKLNYSEKKTVPLGHYNQFHFSKGEFYIEWLLRQGLFHFSFGVTILSYKPSG